MLFSFYHRVETLDSAIVYGCTVRATYTMVRYVTPYHIAIMIGR